LQVHEIYQFGPFRFDPAEHVLLRDNHAVGLTPKALETLKLLVRNSGHLVRKEEIIAHVWPDTIVEESNLNVIIHTLRKALGDDPGESKYIETVAKRGFRFVGDVTQANGTPPATTTTTTATLPNDQAQVTEVPEGGPQNIGVRHRTFSRVGWIVGALVIGVALTLVLWRVNRQPLAGSPATSRAPKSIAVLPFRILSAEKGDEYLSLGLADALITSLSQTRQVVVRQTGAVTKYQNGATDPLAAGREQGVDVVLEGQVQRIGDRVRVSARLVQTNDGTALWADHFDEKFTNIFAVEDAIAERVAWITIRAIHGSDGATTERLTKRYTDNNDAYVAYIKGRYFWNRRTVDSLQKALSYFQQAAQLDPNYSLAYVGEADTYTLLSFFTIAKPDEAFPKAQAAAEKALAIDNTLAEAYSALGQVKSFYQWDWAGAEEQFQKGIALNPNQPLLHHWRSLCLLAMGRMDDARAEMQRALELDPLLLITNVNLGRIDYYQGRYDEAIKQYKRALELDENFMRTHLRLGLAYVQQRRFQEALAEYQRAREIGGDTPQIDAHIAHVLAVSGRKTEALAALAKLQELAQRQYVPPYDIALVYVGLGDKDKAFVWLEKAYNDHSTEMIYFKVDPMLAPLRSDLRYDNLLRRMRLE
jgi:TolB-like protein/DNA-binding winged helix-turn-helix (wHTH) protein/Flp pilus assembly protein TadD